ncbi:MAG: ABC-three component system protein [Bryobacteraceae bacterium]
MARKESTHEASASATGYLYQCRIALLLGLRAIPLTPDLKISVEKFDDVAFDCNGTPSELVQTKHHIGSTGNLSNASSDLWNTLLIWVKAVKADIEAPFHTKFVLLTTGHAPEASAASLLRASSRDEQEADKILCNTAATSSSKDNKGAYSEYTSLPRESRISLLKAITILDGSPCIVDVFEEIVQELYYSAPKEQVPHLVERLEGWWFSTVIKALSTKPVQTIAVLSIDQRVDDLREEFKREALPVDLKTETPSKEVIAAHDKRLFVRQLRRIKIGVARVEYAIRDFYRASEQRSRWLRQDLLIDGELERYEQELTEAWQPRFATMVDELRAPCSPDAKIAGGQELFKWAEQEASFPLRTVRERFLTHGSYHILSNRNVVGWHPEFASPAEDSSDIEETEK